MNTFRTLRAILGKNWLVLSLSLGLSLLLLGFMIPLVSAQSETKTGDKKTDENSGPTSLATFGAGCFWCVEAVFERLDGVQSVTSGYAGGKTPDPTYKEVTSGATGHAEVVRIAFDPTRVSYEAVLDLFWAAHDPTTLNRQGNDAGTQYRSIILYHDEEQKKIAEESKLQAAALFDDPIVTEIAPLEKFYEGEDYHQEYYENNPYQPYCAFVIRPKLKKLEKEDKIPKK